MYNYSVLMTVYNKENPEFFEKSIESIINQTMPTNDFIIVKDGPLTKELDYIIDKYIEKYDYIKSVSLKKNSGSGAASNLGLKYCKNDIVARMDSDDISLPNRCEKEFNILMKNQDVDIVGTDMIEFENDEENIVCLKNMPQRNEDIKKYARRRIPFNHPTVMYRKKAVLECGGYREDRRGEDFALFTKMVFSGKKGININEPLLKYRANINQLYRRSSFIDMKSVMNVMIINYKHKYVSEMDLIIVFLKQFFAFILPKKIVRFLYKKLYRT